MRRFSVCAANSDEKKKKNMKIFLAWVNRLPTKLKVVRPRKRFAASIYYYQLNEAEFSVFALIRRAVKMAVVYIRKAK